MNHTMPHHAFSLLLLVCVLLLEACTSGHKDFDTLKNKTQPSKTQVPKTQVPKTQTAALEQNTKATAASKKEIELEKPAASMQADIMLQTHAKTTQGPTELKHLKPLHPKSIAMEQACAPGERVTIAAVGDVLLHTALQKQAIKHKDRFRSLWSDLEDIFGKVDYVYANLEGPTAYGTLVRGKTVKDPGHVFDRLVYSSYPRFNYHPSVIKDLKTSGVDIVSTANNHSLDRSGIGADRTIEMLDTYNMPYFGTRRSDHKKKGVRSDWHVITEVKGFKIAWVGCTFSTNGLPDYKKQVLFCYENKKEYLDTIRTLAKDKEHVDVVIATPHWGWEYTQNLRRQQVQLAKATIEAGAAAVVAGHPHVIQKWMTHKAKDGREGFILFSLGNFVSYMDEMDERAAIMLLLGLTRPKNGGPVFVNGVRHVPLYMYHNKERHHVRTIERGAKKPEALGHILKLFGSYNMQHIANPIDTTPQCRPEWKAPIEWHEHNGWLGGACEEVRDCKGVAGVTCDASRPQGFCALPCTTRCPHKKGRRTVCTSESTHITKSPATDGVCHIRCKKDAHCRAGYVCGKRLQTGKTRRLQRVCVPKLPQNLATTTTAL